MTKVTAQAARLEALPLRKFEGEIVASADSPDEAICPACSNPVQKRKRCRMDGKITYHYRHAKGTGENCPRRYHPTS